MRTSKSIDSHEDHVEVSVDVKEASSLAYQLVSGERPWKAALDIESGEMFELKRSRDD
jgi:hypothetical protein